MTGKLRSLRFQVAGLLVLAALAGCGRHFFAEREPWRKEAELACLKSGAVKESAVLVRVEPINGPGMCGADFPLKVAAFGDSPLIGYAEEVRPPGAIPNGAQPRWPVSEPRSAPAEPRTNYPVEQRSYPAAPRRSDPAEPRFNNPYGVQRQSAPAHEQQPVSQSSRNAVQSAPLNTPMSISPPAQAPSRSGEGGYDRTYMRAAPSAPPSAPAQAGRRPSVYDPRSNTADDDDDLEDLPARGPGAPPRSLNEQAQRPYQPPQKPQYQQPQYQQLQPPYQRPASVPLGRGPTTGSIGPVEVKPAATLACPIVSALDQWISTAVQPSAKRWFGQPVTEIRQISAYSCRGMNAQPGARISEHAFGNALDIASFVLADGRRITVKDGWRGAPEEQGFLRDVQGAACQQFTTVLAPGSNRFHYDHIHVDLMRRPSSGVVCNPDAVSGEVVARAARERSLYAGGRDPDITGSIGRKAETKKPSRGLKKFQVPNETDEDDWVEDDGPRPSAH